MDNNNNRVYANRWIAPAFGMGSFSGKIAAMRFDFSSLLSLLIVIMIGGFFFSEAGVKSAYICFSIGHRIIIPLMLIGLIVSCTKGKRLVFGFELKLLAVLLASIVLLSILFSMSAGGIENSYLWDGLFYLAWPAVLAFCVANLFKAHQIKNMMVGILAVAVTAYIIDLQSRGLFSPSGLSSVSFSDSYSPYESSPFSGISFALAAYFCYFNRSKYCQVIAVLFCFMTFKRVFLLLLPVLILVGMLKKFAEGTPYGKLWLIAAVGTILCSIAYCVFLLPGNTIIFEQVLNDYFGVGVYDFTMGRDTQLYALVASGFRSSGYMSSLMWVNGYVEMEYCRIYLELGFLGVCVFALYFWAVARRGNYAMLFMLGLTINLIASWSLSSFVGWFVSYVVLYSTQLYSKDLSTRYKGTEVEP